MYGRRKYSVHTEQRIKGKQEAVNDRSKEKNQEKNKSELCQRSGGRSARLFMGVVRMSERFSTVLTGGERVSGSRSGGVWR